MEGVSAEAAVVGRRWSLDSSERPQCEPGREEDEGDEEAEEAGSLSLEPDLGRRVSMQIQTMIDELAQEREGAEASGAVGSAVTARAPYPKAMLPSLSAQGVLSLDSLSLGE